MIAEVVVDISNSAVDRIFDYITDDTVNVGSRVLVPFGNKEIEGYVVARKADSEHQGKLKPIIRCLDDFTAINTEMIDLMWYMKGKYNLRFADILHLFVPGLRGNRVRDALKQIDLIERLRTGGEFVNILQADYGAYSVRALTDKGFLLISEQTVGRIPYKDIEVNSKTVTLNDEQIAAKDSILNGIYNKFLLHGVTGSGKTEVYLSIIRDTVDKGKTAMLLVPEISLTPQMLKLLRGRFGDTVAILHSGLSEGERYDEWCRLRKKEASIVVGARSAVFAPLENLGVIIMDEEHEQSYISESNPRYNTHDIAIKRADYNLAKLILGSATPSVDTYTRAIKGEFQLIELPNRVNDIDMPKIEIINMCDELRFGNKGIFSGVLEKALKECIRIFFFRHVQKMRKCYKMHRLRCVADLPQGR